MSLSARLGGFVLVVGSALSFGACSAGGVGSAGDEPSPEAVSSAQEAIGWSCGTADPSKKVTGGFATRYVSESTYSDCYKGKVVEIDNYDRKYIVGGYTKVSWGDEPLSNEDCTSATVGAYLLRYGDDGTWQRVISKSATGDLPGDDIPTDIEPVPVNGPLIPVPKDPGLFGPISKTPFNPVVKCKPPVVYFYGDDMPLGHYKIVASARTAGKVLHSVAFQSVAGACGQSVGAVCCTIGDGCSYQAQCDGSNKCAACGTAGKACCPVDNSNQYSCDANSLCNAKNTCQACGGVNQPCCDDSLTGPSASKCQGNGICNNRNFCVAPAPPPPCGKQGDDCCSGGTCNPGLTCDFWSATCEPPFNGGGPTCFAEGQSCTGQGSCCTSILKDLTCDPGSSICMSNPNDSQLHRATNCDEPDEQCCTDLPQTNLGGCDATFYKTLHCTSKGTCAK